VPDDVDGYCDVSLVSTTGFRCEWTSGKGEDLLRSKYVELEGKIVRLAIPDHRQEELLHVS